MKECTQCGYTVPGDYDPTWVCTACKGKQESPTKYRFYLEHTDTALKLFKLESLKSCARAFGLTNIAVRPPNVRPNWPDELKFTGTPQQVDDFLSYLHNHTEHGQHFHAWNEKLSMRLIPCNGKPWGGNAKEHYKAC